MEADQGLRWRKAKKLDVSILWPRQGIPQNSKVRTYPPKIQILCQNYKWQIKTDYQRTIFISSHPVLQHDDVKFDKDGRFKKHWDLAPTQRSSKMLAEESDED